MFLTPGLGLRDPGCPVVNDYPTLILSLGRHKVLVHLAQRKSQGAIQWQGRGVAAVPPSIIKLRKLASGYYTGLDMNKNVFN